LIIFVHFGLGSTFEEPMREKRSSHFRSSVTLTFDL